MASAAFLDPLILEAVPPDLWCLDAEFRYQSAIPGVGLITIPKGFGTNLASIPRIARILITGMGYDRWAAVVHDYLYSTGQVSRAVADAVFREALAVAERLYCRCESKTWVGRMWNKTKAKTKRATMWSAVRLGGWMAYKPAQEVNVETNEGNL